MKARIEKLETAVTPLPSFLSTVRELELMAWSWLLLQYQPKIISQCLKEKTRMGVTSRSYVKMFGQHWTYYGIKNGVDLYGRKFQEGGAVPLRCKSMQDL